MWGKNLSSLWKERVTTFVQWQQGEISLVCMKTWFLNWEAAVPKFSHGLEKSSRTEHLPTSNCPKLNNCSEVQMLEFLGRPTTQRPRSHVQEGWQQSTRWTKTEHMSAVMSRQPWAQRELTDCVRGCQTQRDSTENDCWKGSVRKCQMCRGTWASGIKIKGK